MSPFLKRMLAIALTLLSLSELLLAHWFALAAGQGGLSGGGVVVAGLIIAATNFLLFPLARRRLHATGFALFLSRFWIMGNVACGAGR